MGAGAAPDDVDDREASGEDDCLEHADDHHSSQGDGGDCELDVIGLGELSPGRPIDQPDRRPDDRRPEDGLRQLLDRRGQEQEHEGDGAGRDQPGKLPVGADRVVHRRA
jgi:hypothetical protein